jgi:hypothetical protein
VRARILPVASARSKLPHANGIPLAWDFPPAPSNTNPEESIMRRILAAAVAASLLTLSSDAQAQVRIGVGAGPVTPLGDLADAVDTGLHGGLALELGLPLLPIGLRADAMVQRFSGRGDVGNLNEFYGTLNGRFDVLPVPLLSAYVTAGGGLYSSKWDAAGGSSERQTDFGINAGVGGSIGLVVVRPFIEVRAHRVLGDNARTFVPVTIGVFF